MTSPVVKYSPSIDALPLLLSVQKVGLDRLIPTRKPVEKIAKKTISWPLRPFYAVSRTILCRESHISTRPFFSEKPFLLVFFRRRDSFLLARHAIIVQL